MRTRSAVALVVALGLFAHLRGAGAAGVTASSDGLFVARALAQGIFEVKISEKAAQRATDADVRKFAQQMVKDHDKTNKKLLAMAADMKLAVAQGLDKDSRETYDRVTRLKGTDFDRAYMQQQIKAHEGAIKLFEERGKATSSAGVRSFVNETLPHLRHHLKEARQVAEKLKTSR